MGTHILRHSWATWAHRRGSGLKLIADVLGHRSLESTHVMHTSIWRNSAESLCLGPEPNDENTMLSKVRAYLANRRALGFQLKCEGLQLQNFARYADRLGHRSPLTNQLAIGWACLPKAADRLYWARRLEIVRTFAQHLVITEPQPRSLHATCSVRPTASFPAPL